jgi:RNA polymerase sigma factor (TIGR02999 family)
MDSLSLRRGAPEPPDSNAPQGPKRCASRIGATEQPGRRHRMGDITLLIARVREGDRAALDSLFQALYPELRRIAHQRLRRGFPDQDLGTTALVHECYLKLQGAQRLDATDRSHFFAYSAAAMRSIVVDIARAKATERRGGQAVHVTLDDEQAGADPAAEDEILRVHEALDEIGALDARLARIVEMRYFGGMSDPEIAAAMDITDRTVRREWQKARLLLAAALR